MARNRKGIDAGNGWGIGARERLERLHLDRSVAWRCAVVALLPLAFWACDLILYHYVPDQAAGLAYQVRINRFTGDACLRFTRVPPKGLEDVLC